MAKLKNLMKKNPGLTEAYKLGRGDGITEPRDIETYTFPLYFG